MPMQEGPNHHRLSLSKLALAWFRAGGQSFGGGAVSLELIRREFVEREPCFTNEEFARLWSLCQVTPGVNQIALAVLLGRELRGTRGIIVSVLAFLSPTFVATVSLAWGYTRIQNLPATQNALRFVIPTTAGLGFATAYRMAVPLLKRTAMVAVIGLALASLVGVILTLPVFAVLVGAGLTGAIGFFVTEHRTSKWNRENGMGTWTRGEANDE